MAAFAIGSSSAGRDLWQLAEVTVYEAREVCAELPTAPPALTEFIARMKDTIVLRYGFDRLADRQGKLLEKLRAARLDTWSYDECRLMSEMLDELIVDEREILETTEMCPALVVKFWSRPLDRVKVQFKELEEIYHFADALSVCPVESPGDEEMRRFMRDLGTSQEFDLTCD